MPFPLDLTAIMSHLKYLHSRLSQDVWTKGPHYLKQISSIPQNNDDITSNRGRKRRLIITKYNTQTLAFCFPLSVSGVSLLLFSSHFSQSLSQYLNVYPMWIIKSLFNDLFFELLSILKSCYYWGLFLLHI